MIYCPKCGTSNREGSKFCNNCGASLASEATKPCPMCGTPNPESADVCQNCQARLKPLRINPEEQDAVLPFAEQGSESDLDFELSDDDEFDLPSESEPEPAPQPKKPSSEAQSWMQRLRSVVGARDDEKGFEPEDEPVPTEMEGEPTAELPDWLQGADAEPSEGIAREEPQALPSWLQGMLGTDDDEAEEQVEEPFVDPTPAIEPDEQAPVPDWLQDLIDSESEPSAEKPSQMEATQKESGDLADFSTLLAESDQDGPSWLFEAEDEADETLEDEAIWDEPIALAHDADEWEQAQPPLDEGKGQSHTADADAMPWDDQEELLGLPEASDDSEQLGADPLDTAPVGDFGDEGWEAQEAQHLSDGPFDELDWESLDSEQAQVAEPEALDDFSWDQEETPPLQAAVPIKDAGAPQDDEEPLVSSEVPDWMQDIVDVSGQGSEAEALAPPEDEESDDIPDWLKGLALSDEEEPEQGQDEQSPAADAMADLGAFTPVGPDMEEPLADLGQTEASSVSEIPDWLQDLAPAGMGAEAAAPGSDLAQADIPDWLEAMRPVEGPSEASGRIEVGDGILAGIEGVLPVEAMWQQPRRAQAMPHMMGSAAESETIERFADILAGQPEQRRTMQSERPRFALRSLTRIVLYVLLACSAIVPIFVGRDWFSQSVDVTDATWGLYDAINRVEANDAVVLAFEYDPATAAELDLQARAILRHLKERGALVLVVSTVPEGPALAQGVWEQVAGETGDAYGQRFINLGYIGQQQTGLRALTQSDLETLFSQDFQRRQPLSAYPALESVKGMADVDLAIVLASKKDTVRNWVEQVQPNVPGLKLGVGVAAAVGLSALPYFPSGQLDGVLIGMTGAAEYEIATNSPALAVSSLASQSLAHLVIIAAILFGNVAAWTRRKGQES